MSRYLVSPKAREDLKDIYRYVARDKPTAAKKLQRAFYESFRMLARQPFIGQACPNLRADLRAFSIGNYVIFYVPAPRCVQINACFTGRETSSRFSDRSPAPLVWVGAPLP